MELVEGESLRERLDRGERTDWREVIELMLAVARALEQAASVGLVHRDIKPGNLLVDRAGHVKVADFGLAKPSEGSVDMSGRHGFVGTPLYLAPEQAKGEPVDHRTDMYSFGATFYHVLAGKPPFSASSPFALAMKHATDPLPPIREVNPDVPKTLARIIERLMAKDAGARYPKWSQIIEALEATRPRELLPGGLIPRTLAFLIDVFPFAVLAAVPLGDSFTVGGWALVPYALYLTLALGWRGRTVGMWLFNLVVTDGHGANPSLWRNGARVLVQNWPFVSFVTLTYAMSAALGVTELHFDSTAGSPWWLEAGFTCAYLSVVAIWFAGIVVTGVRSQKRNIHDVLTNTRVVYG
jgi:uncharacterized RDD family membrane protein YckC